MRDILVSIFAGVFVLIVAFLVAIFIQSFLIPGDVAQPVTGRVVEKIEVATGYNHTLHIIKLEVADERFSHIATSARIWHAAVVGVAYTFEGPMGGQSYDFITEETRE